MISFIKRKYTYKDLDFFDQEKRRKLNIYSVFLVEPDIFSFNFFGKTGKFFLTSEATTVNLVPFQDLKVTFKTDAVTKRINEFDIIDDKRQHPFIADVETNYSNFAKKPEYVFDYNNEIQLPNTLSIKQNFFYQGQNRFGGGLHLKK